MYFVVCCEIFILLLTALCFFVKAVVDIVRKRKVGKGLVITEFACAVLALGLSWTVFYAFISIYDSIFFPPDDTPMVNLVGYDYNECKSTYALYFDMEIDKEIYSSEYPAGAIIEQFPREGSFIEVGNTTVRCVVSKGKKTITVPNVCGVSCENAGNMIEGAGLHYRLVFEYSETVPNGWAISTTPKAGEEVEMDSMVEIIISKGKEPITDDTPETSPDTET